MKRWIKRPELKDRFNQEALPRHVAIIMDGNGRWAKKRGLPRTLGHRAGVEAIKSIIRLTSDLGIEALSLYAFSTENWKRSEDEVGALMGLLLEYMEREIDELDANDVIITTMGDLSALPENVLASINSAVARTSGNTGLTVCFALNYGSRQEIIRAAKSICQEVYEQELPYHLIDEDLFASKLYSARLPQLDLLIRTSGEYRLSNFMLFQAAYAELIFTNTLWPDYDEQEFLNSLQEYTNRSRRFGGI